MNTTHPARRSAVIALSAILLAVSSPAVAQQDPGTASGPSPTQKSTHCPLTRVGTQFVRCDDLTGAGAPAPAFVPEG
ncbi:MAG: hypothetical protein ABIW36_10430 [Terrimesophilobacter sp.]